MQELPVYDDIVKHFVAANMQALLNLLHSSSDLKTLDADKNEGLAMQGKRHLALHFFYL
jgi:hypothetical protein